MADHTIEIDPFKTAFKVRDMGVDEIGVLTGGDDEIIRTQDGICYLRTGIHEVIGEDCIATAVVMEDGETVTITINN